MFKYLLYYILVVIKMKEIKAHLLSQTEKGTYDLVDTKIKEKTSHNEVLKHWEARAERPGVQSVMSARHSVEENEKATELLKNDILEFLAEEIKGKKIFEFGCGIGRMTEILAENNKQVIAVDFSENMLNKARENLRKFNNIKLTLGKLTELNIKEKFDLVFESIVLLHILNPEELRNTVNKMKELSDAIFICEHTYEGEGFPISRYSILRKPEEYEELFKPYKLLKQKTHFCAGDRFTLMLFKKN